jgi:hypothetical protein
MLGKIKIELKPKDVMNSQILIKPMGLDQRFDCRARTAPPSVRRAFFDMIKMTTQGSFTWADCPHRLLSGLISNDEPNPRRVNSRDY